MGYYTRYKLTIKEADGRHMTLEELHEDSIYMNSIREASKGYVDTPWSLEDSCKWYDHDEHMKALSLLHPTTTFILEGEGEENDDIWIAFYHSGNKVFRKAEVVLDKNPPW